MCTTVALTHTQNCSELHPPSSQDFCRENARSWLTYFHPLSSFPLCPPPTTPFCLLSLLLPLPVATYAVDFSLLPNTTQRLSLRQGTNYTFVVNTSDRWKENHAAFVFQLHTQQYNITLTNGSSCTDRLECSTTGSNVGMVTLLWQPVVYYFIASVECGLNCRNESIPVLAAAVPVPVNSKWALK